MQLAHEFAVVGQRIGHFQVLRLDGSEDLVDLRHDGRIRPRQETPRQPLETADDGVEADLAEQGPIVPVIGTGLVVQLHRPRQRIRQYGTPVLLPEFAVFALV